MQRIKGNSEIFRSLKKAAPTILTCVSAAGVVAVAVFSAKAATKAQTIIEAEEEKCEKVNGRELKTSEIVKIAAPCYIPTILLCTVTIAALIGSDILNKKQQAALVAAYTALSRTYKDYREKAKDLYGDEADSVIEDAVMEDRHSDKITFYEEFRDEFFERTIEEVLQAEYHLNRNFALRGYACLNEFYEFLGLPKTDVGDILGWAMDWGECFYGYSWVDFENVDKERKDGSKYCYIHIPFPPTADFLGDPFDEADSQ